MPLASCLFQRVVRYGAGCSNPDQEPENECEPAPNAPYATIPYSLFPIPYSLFPIPYSLFPIPYSLFPIPFFNNSCV
ncbi:MAG: hypothetical protein F6J90_15845 [Moorea sp. SIOASIH]|nr:hypothetical protein [Moorena sp. SIOASIH]